MAYFFTSESVGGGHPDKLADQISDSLLDNFLAFDSQSKVACETLVTTGKAIIAGEVKSSAKLDIEKITRDTINKIGYTKREYKFSGNSCDIISLIHEQSKDINRGVDREIKEDPKLVPFKKEDTKTEEELKAEAEWNKQMILNMQYEWETESDEEEEKEDE